MRLLHHHHAPEVAAEPRPDPVAAAVWRNGLTGAPASGSPVIHAPHASELVEQHTPADAA